MEKPLDWHNAPSVLVIPTQRAQPFSRLKLRIDTSQEQFKRLRLCILVYGKTECISKIDKNEMLLRNK
jgi:hypothetical protein